MEKPHGWPTFWPRGWLVLVALPMSIGVAIASGVPADRAAAAGILSAVIGGFVTGFFAGSPLQISGPAAGLIVITYDISQKLGWEGLSLAVMLTGLFQVTGGLLKGGKLFRAVTPGMIEGMMSGIGMIILLTQAYRLIGIKPPGEGLALGGFINLFLLPEALLSMQAEYFVELSLAIIAFLIMSLWPIWAPPRLRILPGALVSLLAGLVIAQVSPWPVRFLSPARLCKRCDSTPAPGGSDAPIRSYLMAIRFCPGLHCQCQRPAHSLCHRHASDPCPPHPI